MENNEEFINEEASLTNLNELSEKEIEIALKCVFCLQELFQEEALFVEA